MDHPLKSVLRLVTAGSVDDGKSTLIGRLLFDSKGIFADQLESLSHAKHKRISGSGLDLSLLTDGLEAEREQGITIDVAYRYFATPKRKFIIADTPGHEQYTRNMVTGASTADAMVILIDAVKFQKAAGLLLQTKRHSTIAHLLGIEHIVLAVNKMDLVDFQAAVFEKIVETYQSFAATLGLKSITAIPLSALLGDNIVEASANMPWYRGPTLMAVLESMKLNDASAEAPFRLSVQWVARHGGTAANDFRGYMGRIESGTLRAGDRVQIQPSGQAATVKEILTYDGPLQFAMCGQSVTVLLNEHLDISRGDMLTSATHPTTTLKTFEADVCWLSEHPLDLNHRYWLKHTTRQTMAKVTSVINLLDINRQERQGAQGLKMNDVGRLRLTVQQSLNADEYTKNRATGAFILIDEVTHQTAAAGMIYFQE